jgi:type II secretory pathway pseudopilin PulG
LLCVSYQLTIFQIPDATRKIEIEKQREQLQQQKLKLQLQQQQVMQEHLQLQFDAINNEMEKDESESSGHFTSDSHLQQSPTVEKDTEFPDLSSGVLSDDGRIESADEAGVNKSSDDDVSLDSSHTDDSRVDAVVDRHDALHSIPESTSEDDFVLLPSVSTAAIVSGVSQPLPLKFINTTAATPAFTKNISSKITPPQPVSPAQYNTGLFSGQPPLNSPSNWQSSFHISPPHVAVPTVSHSEEPILSSQVPAPRLTHSVLQETTLHTVGPTKPPAADYLDNHEMSLRSKPPTDSEKTVSGVEHRRAPERAIIISDSTSPLFHVPSTVSSTPFLHEGPSTFQFPGDRETDTASYLHFYQQQLLEQQNRIREQQKAIQERQQQRLEQLKQFQERLRGHRHDTGLGKSAQTGDKISQSGGEWKSLIPSTRYFHDDNSSTSTDRAQSERESVDRALSVGIHRDVNPSLKLPQLRTSTTPKTEIPEGSVNDTSSSLSRFPSEVISIKDDNVSLVPKTSDLGLWSDSTPHLSSSDATKSSLSALNDCKSDRKLDDKPSHLTVRQEFRISGSSLSNSSNGKLIV